MRRPAGCGASVPEPSTTPGGLAPVFLFSASVIATNFSGGRRQHGSHSRVLLQEAEAAGRCRLVECGHLARVTLRLSPVRPSSLSKEY